ncbi:hypothetical protein U1Q18_041810, partial [Sarracenia purpurea var. burkii]
MAAIERKASKVEMGLWSFRRERLRGGVMTATPKIVDADGGWTLTEGAMVGYTPKGMQLALQTLEMMTSRGFFLSPKMGNDLLLAASGEKTGGYTMANYVWDLMQARKITPSLPAVEAYYNGLK